MKALSLLPVLALLSACAPTAQTQPTYTYEGEARFLLLPQKLRVTYTVNPGTHEARGEYRNLSSGDTFTLTGTQLPGPDGETLTAKIDPGDTPRLNASLLGFGISNVPLKASGTLSATITATRLSGTLRVNGLSYPVTLTRVR
ncbi:MULTISPECIES: hypothetical protein [Deinococcus]|jgi:hypothetical protein|uniref:Lipoprotein n=1 Tax=Deinococcus soli (ex Cha et al. 2016) TaxID=1309411 RepID=A0A0F7JN05_9DEIO|nr:MULTISPECIES: hypothetical protein [Deinococcus]AKH16188.1 hypothetical protein SY84_02980 [Deinococcus soli (ex Cha et al. 2016)]MDK2011801.1 hypothetical protein [Deinococcus sp. 43]